MRMDRCRIKCKTKLAALPADALGGLIGIPQRIHLVVGFERTAAHSVDEKDLTKKKKHYVRK